MIFDLSLSVMKQIVSIFLSLLLLASSTGITYAKHFCGDFEMMAEVTLGEKSLSCGMVMEDKACGDGAATEHNCCDNEYTQVDVDDNFAHASFDYDFQQPFITAFVSVFVLQELIDIDEVPNFQGDYHPPPLYKDIPVLYETFLI